MANQTRVDYDWASLCAQYNAAQDDEVIEYEFSRRTFKAGETENRGAYTEDEE